MAGYLCVTRTGYTDRARVLISNQIQSVADRRIMTGTDDKLEPSNVQKDGNDISHNYIVNDNTDGENIKVVNCDKLSAVSNVRPTGTGNYNRPPRIPVLDQQDFDNPAAKAYIPVIVCAMIALVTFCGHFYFMMEEIDGKEETNLRVAGMTPDHNCSRLIKPCASVRIDPCDCRYYYECSPQDIYRRSCANAVIFNAKTKTCDYPSLEICDTNRPWNRCRLEDFGISKDQIQSVAACRKFWPEEMKNWKRSLLRRTIEGTEATSATNSTSTVTSKTATTKWSIATNHPLVPDPTSPGNEIRPSRVPVSGQQDFDNPVMKTYIPVMVCAMIALVAFVAIIILWKKRSDVKTFVAGLCCVGGKEMSKAICNPGYENTISTCDTRLDQSTGEHVYHEIPCRSHASVVNRPLPQTPPQQQQQIPWASTFSGFGCPDVAIRKEQQLIQRTNSACQAFDKLTSNKDRSLIDAQERFVSEYQLSSEKNPLDRKTETPEQQAADKTRTEISRSNNANSANQKGSLTVNGVRQHRISSGKLTGIKDLEISTSTINPSENTTVSGPESFSAPGNSLSSLSSEKNDSSHYSGVWNGISISGKTDTN